MDPNYIFTEKKINSYYKKNNAPYKMKLTINLMSNANTILINHLRINRAFTENIYMKPINILG